jgi:hypothetical protein
MYGLSAWNDITTPFTTWEDLAYKDGQWLSWVAIAPNEVTCPSIKEYGCGNSIAGGYPAVTVYNVSDNLNILRLYNKNEPVLLDDVTKIVLKIKNSFTVSSAEYPEAVTWSTGAGIWGLVNLRLGDFQLLTTIYTVALIVYDPINTLGLYWGQFRIKGIQG